MRVFIGTLLVACLAVGAFGTPLDVLEKALLRALGENRRAPENPFCAPPAGRPGDIDLPVRRPLLRKAFKTLKGVCDGTIDEDDIRSEIEEAVSAIDIADIADTIPSDVVDEIKSRVTEFKSRVGEIKSTLEKADACEILKEFKVKLEDQVSAIDVDPAAVVEELGEKLGGKKEQIRGDLADLKECLTQQKREDSIVAQLRELLIGEHIGNHAGNHPGGNNDLIGRSPPTGDRECKITQQQLNAIKHCADRENVPACSPPFDGPAVCRSGDRLQLVGVDLQ